MENTNPAGLNGKNNMPVSGLNSPSKIPAPKSRASRTTFSGDAALAPLSAPLLEAPIVAGQKRKDLERSPPKQFLAKSIAAQSNVRTYKASAMGTARPPVTKPAYTRSASSKPQLARPSLFTEALQEVEQLQNSKKRANWDVRGRLEDMEQVTELLKNKVLDSNDGIASLQEQLEASEARVRELEAFRQNLNTTVVAKEAENSQIEGQFKEMKVKFEIELASKDIEFNRMKSQLQCDLDMMTRQRDTLRSELDLANSQVQESRIEASGLKAAIARNSSTLIDLESQIAALKAKIDQLDASCQMKDAFAAELTGKLEAAHQLIKQLEDKVLTGESIRRKLHNDVQELKGNIRVFCRVRPLLKAECSSLNARMDDELSHIVFGRRNQDEQEEIQMVQTTESASGQSNEKVFPFAFDKVFGPGATQDVVFDEISQLVQSALDGYRVCIFAYGQTGSGKTFTMEGGARDNSDQAGMIPRAVNQIFSTSNALKEKGWTFSFEASYLEIYNESIRDLLSNAGEDGKYEIRHNNGKTMVTDLHVMSVQSPQEIMGLLSKAAQNRAVAETQCNERSSRSHSVFTLRIVGENNLTTEKVDGSLNLIDLAGSERLSQSGSTGDRLKETQAINKSLSSLGDVIYALANKEAHVPFRNSKLTYLLQHSLGGNCKTLMFVNVSPARANFQETLCSLRFATKVNACQIGTARRSTSK